MASGAGCLDMVDQSGGHIDSAVLRSGAKLGIGDELVGADIELELVSDYLL